MILRKNNKESALTKQKSDAKPKEMRCDKCKKLAKQLNLNKAERQWLCNKCTPYLVV